MARILHLTDLHLGEPADWQYIDERKHDMISGDRRAEKQVLGETIQALINDETVAGCDAVVISGDLTHRAKPDGFQEFGAFVDRLLAAGVEPGRIVVVPGNHDVPWDPGPDADGRYEHFLAVTRGKGLVTPLLDRIDFDEDGTLKPDAAEHEHLVQHDEFVIVALNSSHFCWGMESLDVGAAEELLRLEDDSELAAAVTRLRRHDVARISNAQMQAVEELLRSRDPLMLDRTRPDPRVRIGVLHHQLLPIGSREELKAFESLSNLGAVRELLAELNTSVVLHGHKHESAMYWDYIADQTSLATPPHRMLVCAGPGRFRAEAMVLRLLEIGPRAGARDVDVVEVQAARRPRGEPTRSEQVARLWAGPEPGTPADGMSVSGATVSEAYARIQSLFARRTRPINDLICEVADGSDAGRPPDGYPWPEASFRSSEAWMADLIEWWQLPHPSLLGEGIYNHGERLHGRWGDQVERAAAVLVNEPHDRGSTTRAIMLLIDPEHEASRSRVSFPSFVLVQLHLISVGTAKRLDCTGYFRKQEMRYWWPINVAELQLVQAAVLAEISGSLDRSVVAGRLRTITGQALVEDRLPAVALPAIDRALDQRPDEVWQMAFGLVEADEANSALRRIWASYLDELMPSEDPHDTPPVSRHGLAQVLTYLDWLRAGEKPVAVALRSLVDLYRMAPDPSGVREALTPQAIERLNRLSAELDRVLGPVAAA